MVNQSNDIRSAILRFLEPNVTQSKKTVVRLFERERSVKDFSISYIRTYNSDKERVFQPILNFTILVGDCIEFLKSDPKALKNIRASKAPNGYAFKETKDRRIISVYFDCDLVYTDTNKRRYDD